MVRSGKFAYVRALSECKNRAVSRMVYTGCTQGTHRVHSQRVSHKTVSDSNSDLANDSRGNPLCFLADSPLITGTAYCGRTVLFARWVFRF